MHYIVDADSNETNARRTHTVGVFLFFLPSSRELASPSWERDFYLLTNKKSRLSQWFGLGSLSALSRSWGRSRSRESPRRWVRRGRGALRRGQRGGDRCTSWCPRWGGWQARGRYSGREADSVALGWSRFPLLPSSHPATLNFLFCFSHSMFFVVSVRCLVF